MYVNIFGLGSYCRGHFVNLFRCKRLKWDNLPLPSVFIHNWVLLAVQVVSYILQIPHQRQEAMEPFLLAPIYTEAELSQ